MSRRGDTDWGPVSGVYFIQPSGRPDDPIKIGYSGNVEQRLREHQVGSPYPLRILGVLRGVGPETERRLHQRFAEDRLTGEWFKPSELLVRLAFGHEEFLGVLVSRSAAAKVLGIPSKAVDAVCACSDHVAIGEYSVLDKRTGGPMYWLDDIQEIARAVEEKRVEQDVRKAVAMLRKQLHESVRAILSPESIEFALRKSSTRPESTEIADLQEEVA